MAGRAIIDDADMIECRVLEGPGYVTCAAVLGGRKVAWILADGFDAIVAGCAICHDAGVIKHTGDETVGGMAQPAIAGSGYMGSYLSFRRNAVMA